MPVLARHPLESWMPLSTIDLYILEYEVIILYENPVLRIIGEATEVSQVIASLLEVRRCCSLIALVAYGRSLARSQSDPLTDLAELNAIISIMGGLPDEI